MDNILKLLLGVLGVAGVLAMLTPSNESVVPPVPEPSVEVASPVNKAAPPDKALFAEPDDAITKFGEPMIDVTPIDGKFAPRQQNIDNSNNSVPAGNGNQILNYQQILDHAARGDYGLRPYQSTPTIVEPVEESGIVN